MANVARLDSRARREFVEKLFTRHPQASLSEANDELKKKFKMGMNSERLTSLRTKVQNKLKKNNREDGVLTPATPPSPSVDIHLDSWDQAVAQVALLMKADESIRTVFFKKDMGRVLMTVNRVVSDEKTVEL